MADIMRNPTSEEMKDYTPLTSSMKTTEELFKDDLRKYEKKYTAEHKPFCRRCAIYDFQDLIKRKSDENARKFSDPNAHPIVYEKLHFDFDKYAHIDRFELIGEKDVIEEKLIDRIKTSVVTGKFYDYRCKERNCGITVQVPDEVKLEKKK